MCAVVKVWHVIKKKKNNSFACELLKWLHCHKYYELLSCNLLFLFFWLRSNEKVSFALCAQFAFRAQYIWMTPGFTWDFYFIFKIKMFVIMKISPSINAKLEKYASFASLQNKRTWSPKCWVNIWTAKKYAFEKRKILNGFVCPQTISEYPITYDFSGIWFWQFLYRSDSCVYYLCRYMCIV